MKTHKDKTKDPGGVSSLNFDSEVIILLKKETGNEVEQGEAMNEECETVKVAACVADVPRSRTHEVLADIRSGLKPGYLAFIWAYSFGPEDRPDKIGIINSSDHYDILRMKHTAAYNYDITNRDIIETIRKWESRYPLGISGADRDWVEIEFKAVPDDLEEFVKEVYEFCPGSVEVETGPLEALAANITVNRQLFLSWGTRDCPEN